MASVARAKEHSTSALDVNKAFLEKEREEKREEKEGQLLDEPIPQFSSSLETALVEVMKSEDPLDSPDFDPVAHVNKLFPDEASVTGGKLDTVLNQLRKRVVYLSDNITKDVREHSTQRQQTKRAVESASSAIQELFHKIRDIKEKAEQSEIMVQEICRDIKSLDYAKKHLTNTIRALRNLHMLVSAVDQLKTLVANKQYKDAASLLKAIADLTTLFEPYKEVPKIKSLQLSVDETKEALRQQIYLDFQMVISSPQSIDELSKSLREACKCVDALEARVKRDLIFWFTKAQLQPYVAVFDFGKEGGALDQTDRRYGWLRRCLRDYDEMFSKIFPEDWNVAALISRDFCQLSKEHLTKILEATADSKTDIQVLIKALQKTIEFERELSNKFRHLLSVAETDANAATLEMDEDASATEQAEAIKQKYRGGRTPKTPQNKELGGAAAAAGDKKPADLELKFRGVISDVFTPFMGGYVELERKNIQELLDRITREEKWTMDTEDDRKTRSRLGSSDEMFLYIKKSIKRCSKLTTNQIFFNLFKEYKRGLVSYMNLLADKLPKKTEVQSLTTGETLSTCLVVNTAAYCHDTVTSLQDGIKKIIDELFKTHVDLTQTQDEFGTLINKAIGVVINGVMARLNRVLLNMTKLPWSTWERVGDQSEIVNQTKVVLQEEVPPFSLMLVDKYHTYFCTQLASAFIPKYVATIYKLRRISETGAQQLALDAHAIKSLLLDIPVLHMPRSVDDDLGEKKKPTARKLDSFKRYVEREMGKAENLLKLLVTPADRLVLTFKTLLPQAEPAILANIMNLRGMKKSEQQNYLDVYNASADAANRIAIDFDTLPTNIRKLFQSTFKTDVLMKP